MNKRALSPLIATVLLIAFAVALGVMIMTWTSQLPSSSSQCEAVSLIDSGICYNGEELVVKIRNNGDVNVDGISFEVTDQIKIFSFQPLNMEVSAGQSINRNLKQEITGEARLDIFAMLNNGGSLNKCKAPARTVKSIPSC